MTELIVTTTNEVAGRRITRHLGIVVGEAILGVNIFKDMFAGIRDIVGGRSGAYEAELAKARESALADLEQSALDVGASAVVGVDIDYEVIGMSGGNMLLVSVSGTAVRLD